MKPAGDAVVLTDLPWEWRSKAELFRDHEEVPLAIAYEKCADALEEALYRESEAPLTISEASKLSGYSTDHLGRLVREGKIPNAGRPGAPRIAPGDLPIRTGVVSRPGTRELSPTQIVRSAINAGD